MSLASLIKEAGVGKVSKENIADTPLVQETVVSPVDSPSAAIPVAPAAVVSTEPEVVTPAPVVEPAVVESVVAPVVEPVPADVVTDVAVVDELPPADMVPVEVAEAAVADAVEITQIAATGELIEAEQAAVKEKADELLEIQTALEHLTTVIRKSGANGIANQTAEAIQIQLRSVNRKLGITSQFVSTESFTARDPRAQHDNATIALESIKTSAKVAKNKFMEILEKMIDFFRRAAHNYLDGANALEKKVDELDRRLGALKKTGGGGSMTIANAGLVLHDDSIDIPADVHGLAHFAAVGYPEAVVKYLDQSTKTVLKFRPEDTDEERIREEFTRYARPLKFLIEQKADQDVLPGGFKLDIDDDGMSFGIKGEVPAGVSKDVDLATTVELRKKVRNIKEIVVQIKEIRPEVDKIDKAAKRLIEAAKRVAATDAKDEAHAERQYMVLFSAVLRSSAAKPRIDEVIKYLVRYLNAQVAIVNTMADAIEKEHEAD